MKTEKGQLSHRISRARIPDPVFTGKRLDKVLTNDVGLREIVQDPSQGTSRSFPLKALPWRKQISRSS